MQISDIQRFLKENNLSQEEFSKQIGYNSTYVSKIMNGKHAINDKFVAKFNRLFKRDQLAILRQSEESNNKVPYIGQEITATASMAMADALPITNETFVRLSMLSNAEFVLPVRGHSMKGYINNGDYIAVRRVINVNRIIYGEPYVIITKETNMRTIKFVNEDKENPRKLWLSPYNTEQFSSQSIEREDIYEIWIVLGRLTDINI